jgi:hypothetical protein
MCHDDIVEKGGILFPDFVIITDLTFFIYHIFGCKNSIPVKIEQELV